MVPQEPSPVPDLSNLFKELLPRNPALLCYYFFFPGHAESLPEPCESQEAGREYASFGGEWACMAILLSQSQIPRRGFAILFCGMLILILGAAKYLSPVSPLLWAILASTPLFVLAGRWIPARLRPWQRGVIRLAIAAIPLFTSLTLAIIEFNHQPRDDGYYYQ